MKKMIVIIDETTEDNRYGSVITTLSHGTGRQLMATVQPTPSPDNHPMAEASPT